MDTITHIALGACAGEVLMGKKIGKKAMLLGAFANSIPDLDFITAFWMDVDDNLLAHRGFTHSFLFGALATLLMALVFQRWYRSRNITLRDWAWFFGIEILVHLFIDAFNAYGTGWFEPFSHYRVSFNTIFVADPFYSVWLGIAFVILLFLKKEDTRRAFWLRFGLGISTLYFMYCIVNKIKTDTDIKDILEKQGITYNQYFTTPTPLNNWLWYIVAGNDSGFHIGYYSVFDRERKIDMHYFPRNDSLLEPVDDTEDLQNLRRFSQGFYTAQLWGDTLVFNDLRFGQMVGWYRPDANFVFHYFLQYRKGNNLVVQRGRFANWSMATTASLVKRIRGN